MFSLHHFQPVGPETEAGAEKSCGTLAEDHSSEEDLEVFHYRADLGIDGQIEGHGLFFAVQPKLRFFHRVVDPVVDIEGDLAAVAHP